jgi:hypothetical protein
LPPPLRIPGYVFRSYDGVLDGPLSRCLLVAYVSRARRFDRRANLRQGFFRRIE